jgi:hypothetical protein
MVIMAFAHIGNKPDDLSGEVQQCHGILLRWDVRKTEAAKQAALGAGWAGNALQRFQLRS